MTAGEPSKPADARLVVITQNQRRFASFVADVLVYTVVLNLFVEYVDGIVIDSFTISILTAVLLKLLLDVIRGVEHRIAAFFKARDGTIYRVLGPVSVFAVLFLSKFVILEVVDIVFGDHVELHGFIEIVTLIVAMIVARRGGESIYRRLGADSAQSELA